MQNLLPIRLKPLDDEILSSWLIRLAMAHGIKAHSFCSLVLPQIAVWNRDIDKCADSTVSSVLSRITGVTMDRINHSLLVDLEGFLYETHNKFGPTPWILPVGVFHRKRVHFGMQYCPLCLAEDKIPYFRRKWRLAFMVSCEIHHIQLFDRCFRCSFPVNFHRSDLGEFHKLSPTSLTICNNCRSNLCEVPFKDLIQVIDSEVIFIKKLIKAIEEGYISIDMDEKIYSFMFFMVLHQIMKTLATKNNRILKLKQKILRELSLSKIFTITGNSIDYKLDIQEQSVSIRRYLLFFAEHLLSNWPDTFINLSNECKIWSSVWLKNMSGSPWDRIQLAPYWFYKIVDQSLYKKKYSPSDLEIQNVLIYFEKNSMVPSRVSVSELIGAKYLRKDFQPVK